MCGILGFATTVGSRPPLDRAAVCSLRDEMSRRGPDDAGVWDGEHVILAHRRLAVVDVSQAGHQPMQSPRGDAALVYNGELYNDAELRDQLRAGHEFRSHSDTETVLAALRAHGLAALASLRGMFAIGYFNAASQTLLLARDPLGIKPLYWRRLVGGVAFASTPAVLAAIPGTQPKPDWAVVSAYLTTIRNTLGERTLFDGIRTVLPGQAITFDLSRAALAETRTDIPWPRPENIPIREAIEQSVRRHLRADVPTCCLLSGGLDSSIVCRVAKNEAPQTSLKTYASGAVTDQKDDLWHARLVADALGSEHTQAPVTRELFSQRWPWMVSELGLPLSTPNEVAINEVARRLRSQGCVVALSGEGADELFGGYEGPLSAAASFVRGTWTTQEPHSPRDERDGGLFQLHEAAWMPLSAKPAVLSAQVWRGIEGDGVLIDFYRAEFERLRRDDELSTHLRFMRRINLAGLLSRLDTATMLEGVEGRTPFADIAIAALAESMPMTEKFDPAGQEPRRTKICLRREFGNDLPREVVARPKASFPLPFDGWLEDNASVLRESAWCAEAFTQAAVYTVAARPGELWRLAWPMINLALWARRWWG
ncbi:MAG: asparagine synthase (glutamine-hydrolyzing) [Planctomycetes bacterium]|nr:asparagine synthase (glutamine-hydrolyzing) [Planctomycetota bacterium]